MLWIKSSGLKDHQGPQHLTVGRERVGTPPRVSTGLGNSHQSRSRPALVSTSCAAARLSSIPEATLLSVPWRIQSAQSRSREVDSETAERSQSVFKIKDLGPTWALQQNKVGNIYTINTLKTY